MTDIKVMYSDFSIVKKSSDEINELKKDGILFMLIKEDEKNLFSLSGFDNYGIDFKERNYVHFNDEDGATQSFDNGTTTYRHDLMPKGFIPFRGSYTNEWEKATKLFNEEMV